MLYRGQGISDTAARNLALGKPAKTKKMKTLLTSWSKSEQVAREFAEVALTNHGMSAAVIAVPASMLTVVVDFEQVDGAPTDEREVLCLHEVIPLNADTVIAYTLWDEDEHS